jgi:hypothetical protein
MYVTGIDRYGVEFRIPIEDIKLVRCQAVLKDGRTISIVESMETVLEKFEEEGLHKP